MNGNIRIKVIDADLEDKSKFVSWDADSRHLVLRDNSKVTFEIVEDGKVYGTNQVSGYKWDLWDIKSGSSYKWSKTVDGVKQAPTDVGSEPVVTVNVQAGSKSKEGYWLEAFIDEPTFGSDSPVVGPLTIFITFEPPEPKVNGIWLDPITKEEISKQMYLGQWVLLRLETEGLAEEQIKVSLWDESWVGNRTSILYENQGKFSSNEIIIGDINDPENTKRWKGTSMQDSLLFPKTHEAIQEYTHTIGPDGTLDFLISLSLQWKKHGGFWDNLNIRVLVEHPLLEKYAIVEMFMGMFPNRYDPMYLSKPLEVRLPKENDIEEDRPESGAKTVIIEDSGIFVVKGSDPCH